MAWQVDIPPPEHPQAPKLVQLCSSFQTKRKPPPPPSLSSYSSHPKKSARASSHHATKDHNNNNNDDDDDDSFHRHHKTQEKNKSKSSDGPAVQIRNGEIVLQESSIVVAGFQTAAGAAAAADAEGELEVVEEEAQLAIVGASYHSFRTGSKKPNRSNQWTVEETQLFYDALRQVGVDFFAMQAYFEHEDKKKRRNRKQLKRKYQMELTKNPELIEAALDPTAKQEIGKKKTNQRRSLSGCPAPR